MTNIKDRLTEAADYLDYLYEGSKHVPDDLFQPEGERSIVLSPSADRPVAQFFWGGVAEVFVALGPAVLPLLAQWLRDEAVDVEMIDRINAVDPDNDGKTRVLHKPQTSDAFALADRILKGKP